MQLQTVKRRNNIVSLTPLIDVVFILLLFFMLSSSFIQWRQLSLTLPSAAKATQTRQILPLEITLRLNGQLLLGDQEFSLQSFLARPQFNNAQGRAKAVLLIKADSGVKTQALIHLLDEFNRRGIKRVSLAGLL